MAENATETQKATENTQTQQLDINAIAEVAATAAASKAVEFANKTAKELTEKRLGEAAQVLSGQPKETQDQKILGELINSPSKVFSGMLQLATEEATKKVRSEIAEKDDRKALVDRVSSKYLAEYPTLNDSKKFGMVEGLMERNLRAGLGKEQALENALKDTVESFKLVPASQTPPVGMPKGGYLPNPAIDINKTQSDFFRGSAERLKAARSRGPATK